MLRSLEGGGVPLAHLFQAFVTWAPKLYGFYIIFHLSVEKNLLPLLLTASRAP